MLCDLLLAWILDLRVPAGAGPVPGGMLRFLVIFSLTTNQERNWTKACRAAVSESLSIPLHVPGLQSALPNGRTHRRLGQHSGNEEPGFY